MDTRVSKSESVQHGQAASASQSVVNGNAMSAIDCKPATGGKTCAKCETYKPFNAFYPFRKNIDGYSVNCLACNRGNTGGVVAKAAPAPGVALSRYAVETALRQGERADGTLRTHTDIDRTGIVHRGAVSPAIAGYLRATGAVST
jgi:hypothetical protein